MDDALYVELDEKYVGLLFYDHEDAKATYRIDSVTYVDNKKKKGLPPAWQAECVEVFRQPDGKWCPAKADVVVDTEGDTMVKPSAYQGYALVELFDHENPTRREWVDEYVDMHIELLSKEPLYGHKDWQKQKAARTKAKRTINVNKPDNSNTKRSKRN